MAGGLPGAPVGSLHPESGPDTPGDVPGDVPGRLGGIRGPSSWGPLGLQEAASPGPRAGLCPSGLGVQAAGPALPLLPPVAAACSVAPSLTGFLLCCTCWLPPLRLACPVVCLLKGPGP
ncbi:unnamed protein product [Rangifer tarandus platyrhynchus]|uniref:Uncharacterized protein n=2 Tax=Rangifer tarandus platyrhynchus TaxID=3082113 RepID=A0ABN8ZMA5_RANTA|nr:unnamed protein product [Rangifer tarandus platyrhynchus]